MNDVLSVWFRDGNKGPQDPSLYPMVLIDRGEKHKYHYRVTDTSLARLVSTVDVTSQAHVLCDATGWTVTWYKD